MSDGVHRSNNGVLGDDIGWSASSGPPPNAAVPPGFKSGGNGALAQGEALRSVGALSAPPPPGFNPGPSDRSRLTSTDAIWPDHGEGGNHGDDSDFSKRILHGETRTSSFSNLAAALGTGLAESMEDATRGELKGGALLTDNFFFDPKNDLNYARQSRHAASRLLGTSPSKDAFGPSHKTPEPGSLFATLNAGQKSFPPKIGTAQPS